MDRALRTWPALTIAGLALSGPVPAQSPDSQLPPELLACAAETDVERRLECFDREMAKFGDAPAPEFAETPPAEPNPVPEPVAEPEPDVPQAPEAAAAVAAAPAAEEAFGLRDQEAEQISAVVTDIAHRPYGEFVVLLDNGQIWEQKHRDNRFRIDVGDSVTISKGFVSGFRLSAGDRNNSVQVERLK